MKLDNINEATRRDFLKQAAAGAVAATTGDVNKLAGTAINAASFIPLPDSSLVWDIINIDFSGHQSTLDHIRKKATPVQIADAVRKIFQSKNNLERANILSTSMFTDTLDEYTNGAYTKELNNYVEQVGPVKVVKDVVRFCINAVQDDGFVGHLMNLAEKSPLIAKAFPFHTIDINDDRQVFEFLNERGAIDHNIMKKEIDDLDKLEQKKIAKKDNDYEMMRWADDGGRVNENFSRQLERALRNINS